MILDCHSHYLPEEYINAAEGTAPGIRREGDYLFLGSFALGPIAHRLTNLSAILEEMEQREVDVRVISPPPFTFCYGLDPGPAERLARIINDGLALAAARTRRLLSLGVLPLQYPALAVKEMERAVGELGLRGAIIGTQVNGRALDDEEFSPVFEAAEGLGVPLFIHPDYIPHPALSRHYLVNLVGNPCETTGTIASLIFGGVLTRFPRLRILCAHGGGAAAFLLGRLERGWEVRPEIRSRLDRSPVEVIRRLYFDSVTHSRAALRFLIDTVGGERLVYGTDDPFDMATRRQGPDGDKIAGESLLVWLRRWSSVGERLFGGLPTGERDGK